MTMDSAPAVRTQRLSSSGDTRTLVLLRHGQSTWNLENRFTGWWDVGLSEDGHVQARGAGAALCAAGIEPDVVHTSLLRRAIQTANATLDVLGRSWIPVRRHWRLNERHYGALTGLNKSEVATRYGDNQVHLWRRSYEVPPPQMPAGHEFDVKDDPRYADMNASEVPRTECLADVSARLLPYWYKHITPDVQAGHTVLVAAHGNSLRALVKHLDSIANNEIAKLDIPTGVPLMYELDSDATVVAQNSIEDRYLR